MFKTEITDDRMYAVIDRNINNTLADIVDILQIQNKFIESDCKRLYITFTECKFMNAAVAVIIGTLPEYTKTKSKYVKFIFPDENNSILKFMKKVGMYKYYMNIDQYMGDNVIPFDKIVDEEMMDKYTEKIMNLAPIKMQKEAQDILSSYIYEIYQNGLFHSKSEIGVYTSGIWMPKKKEFHFSIYDMGTGIPNNIRNNLNLKGLDSIKCVKIAFIDGFTTSKNQDINRGLGLTRLRSFIKLNHGSMTIYTNDVCYSIEKDNKETYTKLEYPIIGTLIIINIVADEDNIYIVEKEKKR